MRVSIRVLLLALSARYLVAESPCSLEVTVVDAAGITTAGVAVRIEEREGGRVFTELTSAGMPVRFCGLGISSVNVFVGLAGFGCRAIVENVPLRWGDTRRVQVTYDRRACQHGDEIRGRIGPVRCYRLIRISDSRGDPVEGVSIASGGGQAANGFKASDRYGRLLLTVAQGDETPTVLSVPGRVDLVTTLSCAEDSIWREVNVTMSALGPAKN